MAVRRIQLLVLDGHGVVLTSPFLSFLDNLAVETGQSPAAVRKRWRDELRTPFWTGQLSEGDLWRHLTRSDNGHKWHKTLEDSYELGPAAGHLRRWSRRVPIWLLSNHRSEWLRPRLERFGLSGYFQRIIVSDEIGVAKPEVSAFEALLAHLVDPVTTLFVDDQARNVAAAVGLGIQAVHATEESPWVDVIDRTLAK